METRMSDPKAIDIIPGGGGGGSESPRGDSRSVNGYFSDATLHKFGDMIAALSAALSEARGKVGEAERGGRDNLRAALQITTPTLRVSTITTGRGVTLLARHSTLRLRTTSPSVIRRALGTRALWSKPAS